MSSGEAVASLDDSTTQYDLSDAEFEAWHSDNEADEWERDCTAMRRAEQNFGY